MQKTSVHYERKTHEKEWNAAQAHRERRDYDVNKKYTTWCAWETLKGKTSVIGHLFHVKSDTQQKKWTKICLKS